VFARKRSKVVRERSSKKEPLSEDDVRALLATVDEVVIVRGRKPESFPASEVQPDDLKGPTGNFRAPIVRRGKTLLVGYHAETLARLA